MDSQQSTLNPNSAHLNRPSASLLIAQAYLKRRQNNLSRRSKQSRSSKNQAATSKSDSRPQSRVTPTMMSFIDKENAGRMLDESEIHPRLMPSHSHCQSMIMQDPGEEERLNEDLQQVETMHSQSVDMTDELQVHRCLTKINSSNPYINLKKSYKASKKSAKKSRPRGETRNEEVQQLKLNLFGSSAEEEPIQITKVVEPKIMDSTPYKKKTPHKTGKTNTKASAAKASKMSAAKPTKSSKAKVVKPEPKSTKKVKQQEKNVQNVKEDLMQFYNDFCLQMADQEPVEQPKRGRTFSGLRKRQSSTSQPRRSTSRHAIPLEEKAKHVKNEHHDYMTKMSMKSRQGARSKSRASNSVSATRRSQIPAEEQPRNSIVHYCILEDMGTDLENERLFDQHGEDWEAVPSQHHESFFKQVEELEHYQSSNREFQQEEGASRNVIHNQVDELIHNSSLLVQEVQKSRRPSLSPGEGEFDPLPGHGFYPEEHYDEPDLYVEDFPQPEEPAAAAERHEEEVVEKLHINFMQEMSEIQQEDRAEDSQIPPFKPLRATSRGTRSRLSLNLREEVAKELSSNGKSSASIKRTNSKDRHLRVREKRRASKANKLVAAASQALLAGETETGIEPAICLFDNHRTETEPPIQMTINPTEISERPALLTAEDQPVAASIRIFDNSKMQSFVNSSFKQPARSAKLTPTQKSSKSPIRSKSALSSLNGRSQSVIRPQSRTKSQLSHFSNKRSIASQERKSAQLQKQQARRAQQHIRQLMEDDETDRFHLQTEMVAEMSNDFMADLQQPECSRRTEEKLQGSPIQETYPPIQTYLEEDNSKFCPRFDNMQAPQPTQSDSEMMNATSQSRAFKLTTPCERKQRQDLLQQQLRDKLKKLDEQQSQGRQHLDKVKAGIKSYFEDLKAKVEEFETKALNELRNHVFIRSQNFQRMKNQIQFQQEQLRQVSSPQKEFKGLRKDKGIDTQMSEMCGSSILSQTQVLEFTRTNVHQILEQVDNFLNQEMPIFESLDQSANNVAKAGLLQVPAAKQKDLQRVMRVEMDLRKFNCDKNDFINSQLKAAGKATSPAKSPLKCPEPREKASTPEKKSSKQKSRLRLSASSNPTDRDIMSSLRKKIDNLTPIAEASKRSSKKKEQGRRRDEESSKKKSPSKAFGGLNGLKSTKCAASQNFDFKKDMQSPLRLGSTTLSKAHLKEADQESRGESVSKDLKKQLEKKFQKPKLTLKSLSSIQKHISRIQTCSSQETLDRLHQATQAAENIVEEPDTVSNIMKATTDEKELIANPDLFGKISERKKADARPYGSFVQPPALSHIKNHGGHTFGRSEINTRGAPIKKESTAASAGAGGPINANEYQSNGKLASERSRQKFDPALKTKLGESKSANNSIILEQPSSNRVFGAHRQSEKIEKSTLSAALKKGCGSQREVPIPGSHLKSLTQELLNNKNLSQAISQESIQKVRSGSKTRLIPSKPTESAYKTNPDESFQSKRKPANYLTQHKLSRSIGDRASPEPKKQKQQVVPPLQPAEKPKVKKQYLLMSATPEEEQAQLDMSDQVFTRKRIFTKIVAQKERIQFQWSHPMNGAKLFPDLKYELEYGCGMKFQGVEQFRSIYAGAAHKCIVADLNPKTQYRFRVRPAAEGDEPGFWSDVIQVTTLDE